MAWVYLGAAIVFELFGTTALKLSEGFTKLWWSLGVAVGYGAAFLLLAQVVKTLPLGLSYAVWSGIGTIGAVVISVWLFKAEAPFLVWVGALLVVAGVAIMNLATNAH